MGGKTKVSATPDPSVGTAQKEMADIAREQLDFAREQYYMDQPLLQRYADIASVFVDAQVAAQRTQTDLAQAYQQRMQGTFYPIEDTLAFDAMGYYDANPEIQKKLEDAYIANNKRLVEDRFNQEMQVADESYKQRKASFDKELGALGLNANTTGADVSAQVNAKNQEILAKEQELGKYAMDSTEYRGLQPKVTALKEDVAKLEALRGTYGDFMTVNPDTGLTLAETGVQERKMGLQTAYDRDVSNLGAGLDSVRAYADAYKSNQQQAAGRARQDVAGSFDRQQQQLQRQMQSFGVDVTSGRFANTLNQNKIMQAATESQAMNQARDAAKQLGWAKRMDAAGLGRGLPGAQASSVSLAQQQGQGALSSQGSILGMNQQTAGNYMSGLGQASNSWGNVGSLGMQASQFAQNAQNANNESAGALVGGLMGLGGAAIGAFL